MKKSSIAIILFLVSLATICSTYAESGPPPLQEVEATGQGANADDAFKQAVNDAVRQVVGTLVSAENLINNDRIIKDEVLTLSNGFVEKVLSQGKTKLADGTWQVKLKCIVRKGQVFTRLQEAKVPTVKFDGVSLFADVVSQIEVQKNSAELLSRAFEDFSSFLVAAKVLNPKPRIVARDENATEIEIDCQAVCDLDRFFSQVAPKLEQALDKTCVGKPMELTDTSSETRRLDISGQKVLTFAPDPFKPRLFGTTRSPIQEEAAPDGHYTVGLPVKGGKDLKKWSYKLYDMDKRLFATWPRRNKAYNGSQQTLGFLRDSAVVFAILVDKNGQYLGVMNVGSFGFGSILGCDISLLPLIADDGSPNRNAVAYEWKARKTLPTSALANIAAIKLVIGRALLYTILDYKKWSARDGGPVLDKAVVQPGFCYFISGTPFAYKLNGDKVFELFCPSPSFQTPEALEKLKDTFRKIDPQQLKENDLQPAVEFLLSPATASGSP